ncbi:MAG: hypothetical protein WCC52_06975 [Nitrosotalea sp.]
MNKKSIIGIGIGIAVSFAILAVLSSTTLAPNTGKVAPPSNATTGGLSSIPTTNPSLSTPITTAKKSYTVELNESVGIAAK